MNVRIVRCMCNLRVGQRVPVRPEAQHARMDPCAVNENVFYTLRLDSRPPHGETESSTGRVRFTRGE